MLISQIRDQDGTVQVVARDGTEAYVIRNCPSTYDLALDCMNRGVTLKDRIGELGLGIAVDVAGALAEGRVLAPIHHPDPAQMFLSCAYLVAPDQAPVSAAGRNHAEISAPERTKTPRTTAQPDWFYKGNGNAICAPGMDLVLHAADPDRLKGPAIAGIYVISADGTPFRIGFSLASDYSGRQMTTQAYVCLAQGRLRPVALGPELLLGDLPHDLHGIARISRDDVAICEKPIGPHEDHMIHGIVSLEDQHFRSDILRQPGHLHIHVIAAHDGPFGDNVAPIEGDQTEVTIPEFGLPLRNNLRLVPDLPDGPVHVRRL
ncbi:hypothetical protein [Roseinatronobacter sp.]